MLNVHSLESFGTHEWPGIRFVVFLQWCMFKCIYCHNPDTIDLKWGKKMSIDEIVKKVLEVKPYFWAKWGVTISGWEPLIQAKELIPLFQKFKEEWIHTTIDTNWFPRNDSIKELIELTDLFLVDVKHINDSLHKQITGQGNTNTLKFIDHLKEQGKKLWVRYVLVPWYSDQEEYINQLWENFWEYPNIKRIEILPYHRLGEHKRKKLGWKYPLEGKEPPTTESINKTKQILEKYFDKVFIR